MTVFLVLEWTSTLQYGVVLTLGIIAALIHICIALSEHVSDGSVSYITIFALVFLYPALVGFGMTIYSWKLQNW